MNTLDPSLAKYLSTSKQDIYDTYHGKKRKKAKHGHHDAAPSTSLVVDDTDFGWGTSALQDDDEMTPVVEHRTSAAFKPVASTSAPARTAAPDIPADEAPQVVGEIVQEAPTASTSSAYAPKKLQGGLQTAAELREESKRRKAAAKAEREQAERAKAAADYQEEEETVYRDKSGKRIDTKAEKAERARQKRIEMEKEMQKMEWGKGLVQREDREKRQRELEEMANRPVARYADDLEMNQEMKEVQRWNDPAARFLENTSTKKKSKGPQKPKYSGPMPAPNRFGIPPGYRSVCNDRVSFTALSDTCIIAVRRWDGVDRSTGFERELMQAGNKRKVQEAAARVFSTEDM
jgi:pre-mRNA-splicing factor CWC26